MATIVWDATGEKQYETGLDRGVLYVKDATGAYPLGVPWNGLTAVTETPSGAEPTPFYADNIKYANITSAEEFGGTIEAFTYPDEFGACDGSASPAVGVEVGQQARKEFGFSYRNKVGNDAAGQDAGYKIHLVYGALAAPSEKARTTINDSPDLLAFSWEFSTTPVSVTDLKPTAHLVIDSTKTTAAKMLALETLLYGAAATPAELPLPDEVIAIFSAV